MFKKPQWMTLFLVISFNSFAADGLIDVISEHPFKDNADNLEKILLSNGMTVFSRVPHNMADCDTQLKNVAAALNKLTTTAAN